MKGNARKLLFVVLTLVVILIGCSIQRPPESPYTAQYNSRLKGVRSPDVEAIRSAGVVWTFPKPLDEVWTASLGVAHQYEGILRLSLEEGPHRRLLFVHGQEIVWKAGYGHKNSGMVANKFLDTWIAVAASSEEGSNQTTVAAAWISPATGEVAPLGSSLPSQTSEVATPQARAASLSTGAQGRLAQSFDAIAAALAEERVQISAQINQTGTPTERWKLIPQATINEFFYHLTTQLYGPERWREKYGDKHMAANRPMRELNDVARNADYDKYANTEEALGNWVSARIRRSFVVVHSSQVEMVLHEVVERLRAVAKADKREVGVYIVASPEINAFALPNGDVFITTGLLEAVDSVDEVAFVLAHELDHLFQHDTFGRLESVGRARKIQTAIAFAGLVAGPVAGAAAGLAAAGGAAAAGAGASLSAQALTNLVSTSVQLTSGALGQSLGAAIVSGYSQETELRADANGARYVWAAGYDAKAAPRLLRKLQAFKAQAEKRKEPIASALLNAEPGLEKRSEEMRALLEKLETPAPAK